jgi:hypothetical protein
MTSVMLTILRHETLTSLTAIFFPQCRLWAGRPVGFLVEHPSEVLSGKIFPDDLQHVVPTNAKLIPRHLCHFMCMESSLTFQLAVQDPFSNARVRWKVHCVLGEVTLRNFLWEKYNYVKGESYAPQPPNMG